MRLVPSLRSSARPVVAALLVLGALSPAMAQTCLIQIVEVQKALRAKETPPRQPPSEAQSAGIGGGAQPTAGSVAAAGVSEPDSGAWGALNKAMNLQAGGDEQGCLEALAEARRLGGVQ